MSGAFNPLHVGHRRMIQIAHELLHEPVALDISIINVDKPPLDYMELQRRLGQFPPEQTIYLTRAATFEEKSRLFPGATFAVGADTLRRIAAPQYYGGSAAACQHAIERIAGRGCRFLVFGRDLGVGFLRFAQPGFAGFVTDAMPRSAAGGLSRRNFLDGHPQIRGLVRTASRQAGGASRRR